MVVCVLSHRFALLAAVGERERLLREPLALGPQAGGTQTLGDVSPRAEAFGVTAGMRVGEALGRCPELRLIASDPEHVRDLWGRLLDSVEGIGAGVESDRPGVAYFEADGLRRLYGGTLDDVLAALRRAIGPGARLGAGASRFVAWAAARQAVGRRAGALVVPAGAERAFLAPQAIALLRSRLELADLCELLERLGIRTLGELAALPAAAAAERFGHPGLRALDLARGRDSAIEPRRPPESVRERLELPEAASGPQLERALELLIARLLSRPERRGRSLRALGLSARLAGGGGWRVVVTLRQASADPERLRLALGRKLCELPAPAATLALESEAFGPPAQRQEDLLADPAGRKAGGSLRARRARLAEAVRQLHHAAGEEAALRVLEVDPGSRIPERRAVLAPFIPARGEN